MKESKKTNAGSNTADNESTLNQRLAARIGQLRSLRSLSLDALAEQSGVSRSMISLIERGESNATAIVLDKLAAALDITLASLFDDTTTATAAPSPLSPRQDQLEWKDPASGYRRRNLSPASSIDNNIQLVEVLFPPGQSV
ncbi:MAG: helix-turn-helix transcriptional regulator, partial [Pseudomonadota bacterium]